MPEFRSKGKGKQRQAYPLSSGKKNKKSYFNYKINPPKTNPPEEQVLEQKEHKKHKSEKPSFSTRSSVNHDIKKIMQKDDAVEYGSEDFNQYKKHLKQDADKQYHKEYYRAKRRQEKDLKREEKQQEREQQQLEQEQGSGGNINGN